MNDSRETLGSRLGFLLLTAGCAIGLGNIWRFPFMAGQNGGACFVAFYLLFLILMGLPVMIMELSIGRASRRTLYGAAGVLPAKRGFWHIPAGIFFAGCAVLMMYYTTVTGWMLAYSGDYLFGNLSALQGAAIGEHLDSLMQSPSRSCFYMLLTVLLSSIVCGIGLKSGVERITKILMAGLFLLLLVLCVRAVMLPGAGEGLKFYLKPDLNAVSEIGWGNVIAAAMGQAFFTLSIGIGSIEIFGSYIGRERSLAGEAVPIICMDTAVALLAGVIIFPACASYGVDVTSGPGLVFISMPEVFNNMGFSRIWGTLFFLFLSAAALTTVIAVFENLIAFMMDEWHFSRPLAAAVNGIAIGLLSLPCALGFNLLSGIQPLGEGSTILDFEDYIVSDNLLPLGALFIILFCGLSAAWGWRKFYAEANTGKGIKIPQWTRWYIFTLLPLAILSLFIAGFIQRWF